MFDTARASDPATEHVIAVLWDPVHVSYASEAVLARLRAWGRVRVVLRARDEEALAIGEAASRAGLPVHAILDDDIALPSWTERAVTLPTGEADKLALTLSDAVLVLPGEAASALSANAQLLGRHVVGGDPGPAPELLGEGVLEQRMDPDAGWNRVTCRVIGRIEKALIELFAWRLQDSRTSPGERTYERSWGKISECMRWSWGIHSYFPQGWEKFCPDQAQTPDSGLVRCYERLDRRASFGAAGHRDAIWLGYLLAAMAVFAAVAGHIHRWPFGDGSGWAIIELVLLMMIGGMTLFVLRSRVQARWMSYRLAAEQLRITRMCLPLCAVPPLLAALDGKTPPELQDAARVVQRVVRDHGAPALAGPLLSGAALEWLRLIVRDQISYHGNNVEALELAEHRLHGLAGATFFVALGAVVLHLVELLHVPEGCEGIVDAATAAVLGVIGAALLLWAPSHPHVGLERRTIAGVALRLGVAAGSVLLLLLLARTDALLLATAAGPALAAALHGIATRLGLTHRIAESRTVLTGLRDVVDRLDPEAELPGVADLKTLRALTEQAARAMDHENQRWHGLLSRQLDVLP